MMPDWVKISQKNILDELSQTTKIYTYTFQPIIKRGNQLLVKHTTFRNANMKIERKKYILSPKILENISGKGKKLNSPTQLWG